MRVVVSYRFHSGIDPCLTAWEQSCATHDDRIENRLAVRNGAADYLEDFGRSTLVIECLLHIVEQPHILDRDHGLIGKSGRKLDLLVREGSYLRARQRQHANRSALAQERDTEGCAKLADLLNIKEEYSGSASTSAIWTGLPSSALRSVADLRPGDHTKVTMYPLIDSCSSLEWP